MKKVLLSAVALGLMGSSAYAGCTATGCTGKITKLYMTAAGTMYVGTDGDEKALNCAGGAGNGGVSNVYMSLKEGNVGKNAMYSLLLTSKTTGTPVKLRIQENTADCTIYYVTTM